MTTSIPAQLEKLMKQMIFISKVPVGKKPNFYTYEYDDTSFLSGIWRRVEGEGRSRMCTEIKAIVEDACQTLEDKRGSIFEDTIVDLLSKMKDGISRLQETYKESQNVFQSLETQKILIDYNLQDEK